MELSFKKWLESQVLGGGLEPPKQDPTKMPGAWTTAYGPNSSELPPTKSNKFKMKKK